MIDKAAVQAAVWDYLRRKNVSVSELARRAGIPVGTLGRMLRDDASYRGTAEQWARLARSPELHLDETEVLAALGFVSAPPTPTVLDPLATIARALRELGVAPDEAEPLMLLVQGAAARARASRNVVSQ